MQSTTFRFRGFCEYMDPEALKSFLPRKWLHSSGIGIFGEYCNTLQKRTFCLSPYTVDKILGVYVKPTGEWVDKDIPSYERVK